MKTFASIALLWLLGILMSAHAEIPKAGLTVSPLSSGVWPAEFRVTLSVPQDHHAYLDKGVEDIYIPVEIATAEQLTANQLTIKQKPAGEYDTLVKATVLRGQGDYILSFATDGKNRSTDPVFLDVVYQLCNEITHVCFRPQHTQLNFVLPVSTQDSQNVKSTSTASNESLSLTEQLLALFKSNKDHTLMIFGLMVLAGILSVATPCVYPMLPITSMFIVNRADGHDDKVKFHASAYLIGIIGTYMLLGLIAGMTGGAFNSFMQSAWVNIGFALFFGFFAISMLGFYELSFMQNEIHSLDQHSARVKGFFGTWLMGTVAGLVISPCVGPLVFALLLQITDLIADKAASLAAIGQTLSYWDKLTIASHGSLLMAGFGLGVGLPFFIVSIVRFKRLPKAGYWMNKIKYAFGLIILYFAYTYFAKGMGVLNVEANVTLTLSIGLVSVWIAVVHCNVLSLLPADAMPNRKMHHFCGVILLVIGIWLVVVGLGQTPIIGSAHANTVLVNHTTEKTTVQKEAGIAWYRSFDAAQKEAVLTGKPIFIDFYASWCANCVAFKEETANNIELNQSLREKVIAVKLIDREPEFEKFRENPEHRQLKIGLPYFAILQPNGKLIWSSTDYKATQKIVSIIATLEKDRS